MLTKLSKNNLKPETPQIFAGLLQSDSSVEFYGYAIVDKINNKVIRKVLWLQNGCVHYFSDLPSNYFNLLKKAYLKKPKAIAFITKISEEIRNDICLQIEIFTYYMYGDLDTTPDIKNGILSPPENFRETSNCPSLQWDKTITIKGITLTQREVDMTDMFAKDYPDKAVALSLNTSHSYLDSLKSKLFKKVGVKTKSAYLLLALSEKVVRNYA